MVLLDRLPLLREYREARVASRGIVDALPCDLRGIVDAGRDRREAGAVKPAVLLFVAAVAGLLAPRQKNRVGRHAVLPSISDGANATSRTQIFWRTMAGNGG